MLLWEANQTMVTKAQQAFVIPCNLIIEADTRKQASQAALAMLREIIGSRVFDIVCIGFDHDEETKSPLVQGSFNGN